MTAQPLLSVRNLRTVFGTMQGDVTAVDDVSFDVSPGSASRAPSAASTTSRINCPAACASA